MVESFDVDRVGTVSLHSIGLARNTVASLFLTVPFPLTAPVPAASLQRPNDKEDLTSPPIITTEKVERWKRGETGPRASIARSLILVCESLNGIEGRLSTDDCKGPRVMKQVSKIRFCRSFLLHRLFYPHHCRLVDDPSRTFTFNLKRQEQKTRVASRIQM